MAKTVERDNRKEDLVEWLLTAHENLTPYERIQVTLVSEFGLTEDAARSARERARDGIISAISGTRKNLPDSKADPIGHSTFNLVWSTFNQNSFFDKRRTPSRKWLDWNEQQKAQLAAGTNGQLQAVAAYLK